MKNSRKSTIWMICAVCLSGCIGPMKLAIPTTFKDQATMHHVEGARGNKMSFANMKTSRIKRGGHTTEEWPAQDFLLQNLALNAIGIQKDEIAKKETARFRYTLTDGKNSLQVYANEMAFTDKLEFEAYKSSNIFNSYSQLQQYNYMFFALIKADESAGSDKPQDGKDWELMMTNLYQRNPAEPVHPFTFIRPEFSGLATDGDDTIFLKAIAPRTTELPNGKMAKMPIEKLSGYELSTDDGVIAIVDMINRNIWFYNELDETEKLRIGAIATAIFARKVRDEKW